VFRGRRPDRFSASPARSSAAASPTRAGANSGAAATAPRYAATAARILRAPIAALASEDWPRTRAADLRRFAQQALERHLERKLHAVAALVELGG